MTDTPIPTTPIETRFEIQGLVPDDKIHGAAAALALEDYFRDLIIASDAGTIDSLEGRLLELEEIDVAPPPGYRIYGVHATAIDSTDFDFDTPLDEVSVKTSADTPDDLVELQVAAYPADVVEIREAVAADVAAYFPEGHPLADTDPGTYDFEKTEEPAGHGDDDKTARGCLCDDCTNGRGPDGR